MSALETFTQLSKIASISCYLVFGGFLLIKLSTGNQTFSITLRSGLRVGYGMVSIPLQDKILLSFLLFGMKHYPVDTESDSFN